jgi:hypothetical protein
MYLEGLIICVNYSDFLAHTLPHNKNQFDNLVVITDMQDQKTKDLCEYYHVNCIQTDIFYQNGDTFNKGAAINFGLSQLKKKDWVVHLDADIYLPPKTRSILENLPLDVKKIYGVDRLMCPSYDKWMEYINSPPKIQSDWIFIHMNAFPVGVRIAEYNNKNQGYEPIGYFQLWNPKGSKVFDYPTQHDFCDRTDVLHVKKFERKNRELLPEIVVIHLDSEGLMASEMGKNWKGRKTQLFQKTLIQKDSLDKDLNELKEKAREILTKYKLKYVYSEAIDRSKVKNKLCTIIKRIFLKKKGCYYYD